MSTNSAVYCPIDFVDSWDEEGKVKERMEKFIYESQSRMLTSILHVTGSRPTIKTIGVRKSLKSYVNSIEGSVYCQWNHVRSRGAIRKAED